MSGTVILSHGFNSSPAATKVAALAQVARGQGWCTACPDFRADDACGHAACVTARVARLRGAAGGVARPLVLVGSSMGAFVSVLAAREFDCGGLFVLALPVAIPQCTSRLAPPRGVRSMLVHGYRDAVCPCAPAIAFAEAAGAAALLLDDGHGLLAHLDLIETQFAAFLRQVAN